MNNLLNVVQKFLNQPFYYSELLAVTDKQKDFLLQKGVMDKIEECEYNALWDTILDLEDMFSFAKAPNLVIGTRTSVVSMFNRNFKERNK